MDYLENIGDLVLSQALKNIEELSLEEQQAIKDKINSPNFQEYVSVLNSQSDKINYMYSYGSLDDINEFIGDLSSKFIKMNNPELIKEITDLKIVATSKATDIVREGENILDSLASYFKDGTSLISNSYMQKITNLVDIGGINKSISQVGDIKNAIDKGETGEAGKLIASNILEDTDLIVAGVKEFEAIATNVEKSLSRLGLNLTPALAEKKIVDMSNNFIEAKAKALGDNVTEQLEDLGAKGFDLLKESIKESFSPELMEKFDRLGEYTDALNLKKVKISYLMNVAARENSLSFEDFVNYFIKAAPKFNEKILDIAKLVGEEAKLDGPDKDSERKIKSLSATVDALKITGTTILVIANIMKIVLLTMKIIKIVATVLKQLGLAKEIGACVFNPANIPALAGKIAKEILNYLTNYLEDFLKKIPEFLLSIKVPVPETMVELMLMNTRKGALPSNQKILDAFDKKKVQEKFNSSALVKQLEKDKDWNNSRDDFSIDWSDMEGNEEFEAKS